MEYTVLSGRVVIPCPEGFHVLDEAEKKAMNMTREGEWTGISDPGRHIVLTAGCRRAGLAAAILSVKDIAAKAEKDIAKMMKPFGFACGAMEERMIGGKKACGFSYMYTAQDIPMYGDYWTVKDGKEIFDFHAYSRQSLQEESKACIGGILDAVKWK